MSLDAGWVRDQFPGLKGDLALLDNAGGTVPAGSVIQAISAYLEDDMVQHGATYARSKRATERVHSAYNAGAELVGGSADGIVLGASTTANLYVLANAFTPLVRPGDEIVVTNIDHESNRGAWIRLAQRQGAVLKVWKAEAGILTYQGLNDCLTKRTKLVAFSHCSNVIGALHDAAAFCRRIREAKALSIVDGVAFAPHRRVNVQRFEADVYALSLYKVFGPHLGLLHVRPTLLQTLQNQNHFFHEHALAARLMPGNVSHELGAGVAAVVDYLKNLDLYHGGEGTVGRAFERIAEHESELVEPLLTFLRNHDRVRLYGPATSEARVRVPTVTFVIDGMSSKRLVTALDKHNLGVRYGHFYAHHAMEAFGLDPEDGVVRVSLVHYNTKAEVNRLMEALDTELREETPS